MDDWADNLMEGPIAWLGKKVEGGLENVDKGVKAVQAASVEALPHATADGGLSPGSLLSSAIDSAKELGSEIWSGLRFIPEKIGELEDAVVADYVKNHAKKIAAFAVGALVVLALWNKATK